MFKGMKGLPPERLGVELLGCRISVSPPLKFSYWTWPLTYRVQCRFLFVG